MSQSFLSEKLEEDAPQASVPLKSHTKNTLLISHGRPPWYGQDGERISDAFVIGVAGGSASGKTHVARQIVKALGSIPTVLILSQDSFYKHHSPEEIALAFESKFDFDHPDAIDMPMFASCLADLKACRQTNIPVYSFEAHQRLEETKYAYGATVIIAEGIMALHDPALRSLYDLKVFVQCDSDLMLARRIARDTKERGRSVEGILEQYLRYVKPSFDNFVRPTATFADIPIELISTHTRRQLQERSNAFRPKMVKMVNSSLYTPTLVKERLEDDPNMMIMPSTPQLEGIFTILRSKDTSHQDFIFFTDRLSTLIVEYALQFLPYSPHTVTTPLGTQSHGKKPDAKYLCGISIQRSGSALERGFRRVINDVPVGTLLIQTNSKDGEPLLLHVKLPVSIRHQFSAPDTWVFLLDAQIGTGAAAFMSIRILLDHGVKQDHIIVCGAVDNEMREGWLEGDRGEGNEDGAGRKDLGYGTWYGSDRYAELLNFTACIDGRR
ncbi:armadillo/beta-catenin/plakoglobin [Gymnopus androsaceus JB14]|uniref:uridine/cytidine kinase n=1 Tax=Gymnopus androsaceus JB14 TaxID=1447944 RepID=A0A6A4HML3_9AGAR|nr:armadillo/beta-catenin/plakoglobin [Gymnopus androsaceus JB14]